MCKLLKDFQGVLNKNNDELYLSAKSSSAGAIIGDTGH